jgi:hypothetical protein
MPPGAKLKTLAVVLIAVLVFGLLLAAMIWVLAGAAVLAGLLWLDMVVVPRLAYRLGVPRLVLDASLLVAVVGAGWWVAGVTAGVAAGALWLAGMTASRLGRSWLRSRVRLTVTSPSARSMPMLQLAPCRQCGVASADAGDRCPACGAPA